jgi:hypothetical protein
MFWYRIKEAYMSNRKSIMAILGILFILPIFSLGQIVPDFKIYNNNNFPDVVLNSDTLHLTYGNFDEGIFYFTLDSSLNAISDTLLIENTCYGLYSSIDAIKNRIAVTWLINYGLHSDIQGIVFQSKINPQIDAVIRLDETPSDNGLGSPKICFLNDTLLASVWHGNVSNYSSDIRGQLLTISNELVGLDFWVNEYENLNDTITSRQPMISSFKSSSDFLVVWIDDRSGKENIYGRLFDLNSIPKDSSFLISGAPLLMDNITFTSMDIDSSGNFIVVWSAEDNIGWNIYYRWFNKNTDPLTPVIGLTDSSDQVYPWSAVNCSISDNGKSIVTWESNKEAYSRIYAQRFNADRTILGEPFRISTLVYPGNQYYTKVILDQDKIYSFWRLLENGIWANVLDFNNPPVSIENTPSIPNEFSLSQNYPNPFNPITSIGYAIPDDSHVKLTIYNVSGKLIETLVDEFHQAGQYSVKWDAVQYNSGLYLYQLITDNSIVTKKMLLIK